MLLPNQTAVGTGFNVSAPGFARPILIPESVKVRRGGVGTHFCIHKYFFDRNPSWKAIRDEEREAETRTTAHEDLDMEETDAQQESQDLNFTPIDARHLSSLPLISGRLVKLLKASQNNMHASSNILITLVCFLMSQKTKLNTLLGFFESNQDRQTFLPKSCARDDSTRNRGESGCPKWERQNHQVPAIGSRRPTERDGQCPRSR